MSGGDDDDIESLPEWRRPFGAVHMDRRTAIGLDCTTEIDWLCGAILDLVGSSSLSYAEIAAGVREEWGDASHDRINAAVRRMVQAGDLERCVVDGKYSYRRTEPG